MSHDAVADGGDDEQPDVVIVETRWGDGKLGAPPNLPPHLQLWEAGHRRWVYVLDMSGVWMDGGCGGSSHLGGLVATGVVLGLGWKGGDGEASDGWVWRDGHADALLEGYKRDKSETFIFGALT